MPLHSTNEESCPLQLKQSKQASQRGVTQEHVYDKHGLILENSYVTRKKVIRQTNGGSTTREGQTDCSLDFTTCAREHGMFLHFFVMLHRSQGDAARVGRMPIFLSLRRVLLRDPQTSAIYPSCPKSPLIAASPFSLSPAAGWLMVLPRVNVLCPACGRRRSDVNASQRSYSCYTSAPSI